MKNYILDFLGESWVWLLGLLAAIWLLGSGAKGYNHITYGQPTYAVWTKLHPAIRLTYEEWVLAKKAELLDSTTTIVLPQ